MLAAVSVVLASVMLPPPVINPAKHVSRSGECVLEVDPSEMYGEGKGSYVLRQGDKILWCGERP